MKGDDGNDKEDGMSAEFAQVWGGVDVDCEFIFPENPPHWLDEQLFDEGMKFVNDYLVGIIMSNGEALVSGLCIPSFYKALTFSGETDQKRAALIRYRDTAMHIFGKWYMSKPWREKSESATSIKVVNSMHRKVAQQIRGVGEDFTSIVASKSVHSDSQPQSHTLLSDLERLRDCCRQTPEYQYFVSNTRIFTQFDMFLVQCSFFGGPLLYPSYYGCCRATDKEFCGFLHVWRVFGYYLGILDEYNGAQFDVGTTRNLGFEVIDRIIKPCCLNISFQTIYLGQKIFYDPSNYYVWIYRNYRMMGLDLRQLWQSFSWTQVYWYYVRFSFGYYLYPIIGVKQLMNHFTSKFLQKIMNRVKKSSVNFAA